jgi:hypothetical protein
MYDAGASDSNKVPREGAGISSHWVFPDSWGELRGKRFGTVPAAYLRTAIHEIGHAMGMLHNPDQGDLGFMNTTDMIEQSATAASAFPRNIQWRYAATDIAHLRHAPDIHVRPGGAPFDPTHGAPLTLADGETAVEGLVLHVTPLSDTVPLGAPVRVDLHLENTSRSSIRVPAGIGLRSGCTRGTVTGPTGQARTFSPLILCVDEQPLTELGPGEAIESSLTLLRGGQGALFELPGTYTVTVAIRWPAGDAEAAVTGSTTTEVTGPVDDDHAGAATAVLADPDALLVVALGVEELGSIDDALACTVLRPHFLYFEARRCAQRFRDRRPDPHSAEAALNEKPIMSTREREKSTRFAVDAFAGATSQP